MSKTVSSDVPQRRGFLKALAWVSGAVALVFGGGKLLAEEAPANCGAELDKLKKEVASRPVETARNTARYLRRVYDRFGPGVAEEAGKLTAENAERWMKNANIPKEQRNLGQVKKFFASFGPSVQYTWVEDTPERLQARVTYCRWAEELKKDGNDGDLGYALSCAFDPGYCAGLNPNIKFTRTKTLMKGDDHCNHLYELKA